MSFAFDASMVVAIAFFICVGLIIKFGGKKINSALNCKKQNILNDLSSIENRMQDLQNEEAQLHEQEKQIKNSAYESIAEAENEKKFIIEKSKQNASYNLEQKINQQKILNEKIKISTDETLNKISWNASVDLLKNSLIGDQFGTNENIAAHNLIINNILSKTKK